MTITDLAWAIAEHFPEAVAPALARHPAFRTAATAALDALGDGATVVAAIGAYGGLRAAGNPHAVVVSRLRWVVQDAAAQHRGADDGRADADHLRQLAADARQRQEEWIDRHPDADGVPPLSAFVEELGP